MLAKVWLKPVFTYNVLYRLTSYTDWNTLKKVSCYLLNFHTLLPTNKGSATEMLTPHKRKETKNVIRFGCLEKMTVTVTGSWRWEENGIFFPKNKWPRAALSCEIREEPLPFISARPPCLSPPPSLAAPCQCRQQGALFTMECPSIASLGSLPYQGRAGSSWPSVDSRLVAHVKPGRKVVDRAQSGRLRVILWQLSAFQSCLNRRRKPVNAWWPVWRGRKIMEQSYGAPLFGCRCEGVKTDGSREGAPEVSVLASIEGPRLNMFSGLCLSFLALCLQPRPQNANACPGGLNGSAGIQRPLWHHKELIPEL